MQVASRDQMLRHRSAYRLLISLFGDEGSELVTKTPAATRFRAITPFDDMHENFRAVYEHEITLATNMRSLMRRVLTEDWVWASQAAPLLLLTQASERMVWRRLRPIWVHVREAATKQPPVPSLLGALMNARRFSCGKLVDTIGTERGSGSFMQMISRRLKSEGHEEGSQGRGGVGENSAFSGGGSFRSLLQSRLKGSFSKRQKQLGSLSTRLAGSFRRKRPEMRGDDFKDLVKGVSNFQTDRPGRLSCRRSSSERDDSSPSSARESLDSRLARVSEVSSQAWSSFASQRSSDSLSLDLKQLDAKQPSSSRTARSQMGASSVAATLPAPIGLPSPDTAREAPPSARSTATAAPRRRAVDASLPLAAKLPRPETSGRPGPRESHGSGSGAALELSSFRRSKHRPVPARECPGGILASSRRPSREHSGGRVFSPPLAPSRENSGGAIVSSRRPSRESSGTIPVPLETSRRPGRESSGGALRATPRRPSRESSGGGQQPRRPSRECSAAELFGDLLTPSRESSSGALTTSRVPSRQPSGPELVSTPLAPRRQGSGGRRVFKPTMPEQQLSDQGTLPSLADVELLVRERKQHAQAAGASSTNVPPPADMSLSSVSEENASDLSARAPVETAAELVPAEAQLDC